MNSLPIQTPKDKKERTNSSLPLIRKPVSAKLIPGSTNIFGSKDLETRALNYDFQVPGANAGTNILQIQNPGLLAFRNRTEKLRSKEFVHDETNITPKPVASSSLLTKRPLKKLKDPTVVPAIETVKLMTQNERNSLAFPGEPVAYFAKRKDGRGHLFIYMVYAGDPKDPFFSPYELKKITSTEIDKDKDYFTMSATGVTRVQPNGDTEYVSLDQWARESNAFVTCRKLRLFKQYFYWKNFRIWKEVLTMSKFKNLKRNMRLYPLFKNSTLFNEFMRYPTNEKEKEQLLNEPALYPLSIIYLQDTMNLLLKQHSLSAYQAARKFKIYEYEESTKKDVEDLKKYYTDFLSILEDGIIAVYDKISNPELVQVSDEEFPDIQRRNPNLGQLMILERKKAVARNEKTKLVNKEIESMGSYIRLIDYILMESMVSTCIKRWRKAEINVSEALHGTIFQVEVVFDDDGSVIFNPPLKDLLKMISWSLKKSIESLNTLPRLIIMPKLRNLLRDGGLDVQEYFKDGPQFAQIIFQDDTLKVIKRKIKESVKSSYEILLNMAQSLKEFFPIYTLGKTWKVEDYIITRRGEKYTGVLTIPEDLTVDFNANHMDEPVVDFEIIERDIQRFKNDEERIMTNKTLASGQTKLSIYVDTKNMRDTLAPIPTNALNDLIGILNQLIKYKNVKISNALKFFEKKLKQPPGQLEGYVEYCIILKHADELAPQAKEELDFIDKLLEIFKKFEIPITHKTQTAIFSSFEGSKKQAQFIRDQALDQFTNKLRTAVHETERKIDHFYEKATSIPAALRDIDINSRLPSAKRLKEKIEQLAPDIAKMIKFQDVMGIELNNFSAYKDVCAASEFAVQLYSAVSQWQGIYKQMSSIPFQSIRIDSFIDNLKSLHKLLTELQDTAKTNYPILNDLISKVNEIYPYISELESLSKGQMQVRHWNTLFEECQQTNSYNTQITIEELLSLGILKMKDKIEQISSTSHGESELESEFQRISNYWNKVQLPLAEQQLKSDDSVIIGPTDQLVNEIFDTLITLQRMLSLPFVQGIRESVILLSSTLENIAYILESWRVFQNNWAILSSLFALEETKTVLPHQANRFATVQRKWNSIARNTVKDTRLFSVCAFPSLLEILNENNKSMESILTSLSKFLDTKRTLIPRLFFLSNDEVLTLATTNVFSVFAHTITKLFMHIKTFDFRDVDTTIQNENISGNSNFQRMKIYGIISEDDETLQFTNFVSYNSTLESWLPQLIETMKSTVQTSFIEAVHDYATGNFIEWVLKNPVYIATTALNLIFSREVESSLNDYFKELAAFERRITKRLNEVIDYITKEPKTSHYKKMSILITQLSGMKDILNIIVDKSSKSSQNFNWQTNLKYKVSPDNLITIECENKSWEHGLEFWGTVPHLLATPSLLFSRRSYITGLLSDATPLLTGSDASGRQTMLRNLACFFGRFAYVVRPFPDTSEFFLSRLFIGAVSSGCWIIFTNIDLLSHKNLSYVFDNIKSFNIAQAAGNPRLTISSKLVDLNRGCKILLTSHPLKDKMNNFPPQFRSLVRPISLNKPDYINFAEVKLLSVNFKNFKIIAPKLVQSVTTIVNFFSDSLHSRSTLPHIIAICNNAHDFYTILEDNNSQGIDSIPLLSNQGNIPSSGASTPLNTKSNTNSIANTLKKLAIEEYCVAFIIFNYFKIALVTEIQQKTILEIIFSAFKISGTIEEFSQTMQNLTIIPLVRKIAEVATNEIQKMNRDLPTEYLISKVIALYNMMIRSFCTIIVGPPNSGKTFIINLLSKCLENPEIQSLESRLKPFVIKTIYHSSDNDENIFGKISFDSALGQIWSYGQIHAVMTSLYKTSKDKTAVLVMNGPLTQSYSSFLLQFLGTPALKRCMLNSLDTYQVDKGIRLLIETDSIANICPSLISRVYILAMKNVQNSSQFPVRYPSCELIYPIYPFSRALEHIQNLGVFDEPAHVSQRLTDENDKQEEESKNKSSSHNDIIQLVQTAFCEIAPTVVKKIHHTKNKICSTECETHVPNGEIIIVETIPMHAAIYAFMCIKNDPLNFQDAKQIKALVAISFFRIFSNILDPKECSNFDTWIQTTFLIDIPDDWVGYTVSDHFWDTFKRPSLISLRMVDGKMIPLDFSKLNDKPYITSRSDNLLPIVQEDIKVLHAQFLPPLHIMTTIFTSIQKTRLLQSAKSDSLNSSTSDQSLKTRRHISLLVYGSSQSGKSSFVTILLKNKCCEGVIPIVIPSSKYHSQESILPFIESHSSLLTRVQSPSSQNHIFALIFENVEPSHINLMEFIRMILVERQIPIYSSGDQKIYNTQKLRNFIVIVTTRQYHKLPIRFSSLFMPIYLRNITITTASFITVKIMNAYGNNEIFSKELIKICNQILGQFSSKYNSLILIKAIFLFCHINGAKKDLRINRNTENEDDFIDGGGLKIDRIANLKTILGQMYYYIFHRMKKEEYADKLNFILKSSVQSEEEQDAIQQFLEFSDIYYPSYNLSKDLKVFDIKPTFKSLQDVKNDLIYSLNIFNANSNEKIALRFSKHILFQISLVHSCLSCPGRNLIIKGKPGSGRFIITRFVTNLLQSDFVNITPPSYDEEIAADDRLANFKLLIQDVITNATIHQKRTVIFVRTKNYKIKKQYSKTNVKSIEEDLLIQLASQRDFISFYNKSSLEELYIRFTGQRQLSYEQRLTAFRQIRNLIRINIKIVVAQDINDDTIFDSSIFDHILLENDIPENYSFTALDCFDGLASRKLIMNCKDKLPDLFSKICDIARTNMQYFHINYYYDFVDCFAHFAATDHQEIISRHDNIQSALEFLNKLESESLQIEKKLDSLAPTLQRLKADSETLISSYTTRKEAIEIRRTKLDEEHHEKAEEVNKLEEEFSKLQKALEIKAPNIDQTQKAVEDLNDNDIEAIRITAADPLPSLKILLEVFCVILDRPIGYEQGGKKLLMDPKFVEIIVQNVVKNPMTIQKMPLIEPYFEMDELNPDELESISPSLKALYDWIENVCKVSILKEKLLQKKKELEDKQRELNEYVEEMNLEKSSIQQVEASLENENKAITESTAALAEMEKEYETIDLRKKSIESIFKGIEHFTEKWQEESSRFSSTRDRLIGDCILFSFYLIFCGGMSYHNKVAALEDVMSEIRLAGIDSNFDNPIEGIYDKFISSKGDELLLHSDLVFAKETVIDAHHVRSTFRTPLLLDPDGLVTNFLISSIKPKRITAISQNSSTLESTIANAICDGKTLILFDANYLHPLVSSIMSLDLITLEQNTQRSIKIHSKLTTWDPRFKLILVTTESNAKHLPEDLLARVTLINVSSSSLEATETLFYNTFIEFFNPDLVPKMKEMIRTEISQHTQIQKYEHDTLDILSDIIATQQSNPNYDYLADEETIADLIRSKEGYFNLLHANTDFTLVKKEIAKAEQPFKSHVSLCHIFWNVMSRKLPKVTKLSAFSFLKYKTYISNIFINEGFHSGSLTTEQHQTLHNSIINVTLQYVFQSLPTAESYFFLFMSSYKMKALTSKVSKREIKAIMAHMETEYNGKADLRISELVTDDVELEVDPLHSLKHSNITNIYSYISHFICDQFGTDYTNYLQYFQIDSIISSSASVPAIIYAPGFYDPTSLVNLFINLRSRHESFDSVSLSDDLDVIRNSRKMLVTASNRGNWVLVHYSKPNKPAADMLTDVYHHITNNSVNTNFRLIIICSTIKYLSPTLLLNSKRVNADKFPSIRNSLLSYYHHHNAIIKSQNNPQIMRKLTYATGLLMASVNFRNFIHPIGYNFSIHENDILFKEFVDILHFALDSDLKEIPLRSIRSFIQYVLFPGVSDRYDQNVIRLQISKLFVPDILNDNFSPCKGTTEEEKWVFPSGELPLSNYPQIIQHLPYVTSTKILHMNFSVSMPLMYWNLSRSILKPFLKYNKILNQPPPIEPKKVLARIENLIMIIPDKIPTIEHSKFNDFIGLILLEEIDHFNQNIQFLRDSLEDISNQLKEGLVTSDARLLAYGIVPKFWKTYSKYFSTNSASNFLNRFSDKHTFLTNWLNDEKLPQIIDVSLIDNIKSLLTYYLVSNATKMENSIDYLTIEFKVMTNYLLQENDAQDGFTLPHALNHESIKELEDLSKLQDDNIEPLEIPDDANGDTEIIDADGTTEIIEPDTENTQNFDENDDKTENQEPNQKETTMEDKTENHEEGSNVNQQNMPTTLENNEKQEDKTTNDEGLSRDTSELPQSENTSLTTANNDHINSSSSRFSVENESSGRTKDIRKSNITKHKTESKGTKDMKAIRKRRKNEEAYDKKTARSQKDKAKKKTIASPKKKKEIYEKKVEESQIKNEETPDNAADFQEGIENSNIFNDTAPLKEPKDDEIKENDILLTNLTLMSGQIDENGILKLKEDGETKTFNTGICLRCRVIKKVDKEGMFYHCPLYNSILIKGINKPSDMDLNFEGESMNFAWEVELPIEQPESLFIENGTALACQVPDQFL